VAACAGVVSGTTGRLNCTNTAASDGTADEPGSGTTAETASGLATGAASAAEVSDSGINVGCAGGEHADEKTIAARRIRQHISHERDSARQPASWVKRRIRGTHSTPFGQPGHYLRAIAQRQLGEDVADVTIGSPLGNDQAFGDLAIAQSARHQLDHFALASRQAAHSHWQVPPDDE
jgi:hypothetical protein